MNAKVLCKALALHKNWQRGKLGGETMPEDVHPKLDRCSHGLLHYLTLGMCLNYQRNSYTLWQACTKTYYDETSCWVFEPEKVATSDVETLRAALPKYKVALQPNKHIDNWQRVSGGIVKYGTGNMFNILTQNDFNIAKIREFIQTNRKDFPYLAGDKICNYWLFVLVQYMDYPLTNRQALSIAPDTHIMQASVRLGLISEDVAASAKGQILCADAWVKLLAGSELLPIDMHTPLWLWSRGGFVE
ncbi:MAG: hypothetical protein COC24_011625 [Alphaproteobacteria bacterium]|nr:hypothetical protein [Alphaproteobacteria bacterium]